jgi:hypothetical protein
MHTLLVDSTSKNAALVGRQWCLAIAAAIFAVVPSGTAAENVAPQPVEQLMVIANHSDQVAEFVGGQGTESRVNSIVPNSVAARRLTAPRPPCPVCSRRRVRS